MMRVLCSTGSNWPIRRRGDMFPNSMKRRFMGARFPVASGETAREALVQLYRVVGTFLSGPGTVGTALFTRRSAGVVRPPQGCPVKIPSSGSFLASPAYETQRPSLALCDGFAAMAREKKRLPPFLLSAGRHRRMFFPEHVQTGKGGSEPIGGRRFAARAARGKLFARQGSQAITPSAICPDERSAGLARHRSRGSLSTLLICISTISRFRCKQQTKPRRRETLTSGETCPKGPTKCPTL